MLPEWQRALTTLSTTVFAVVVVVLLYLGRAIFIPVALAVFLSFVLAPVVTRLGHRGLGRTLSVLVTMGVLVLVTIGIGALIAQQVVMLTETLPDQQEAIKAKVLDAKQRLVGDGNSRFGALIQDLSEAISPSEPGEKVVVEKAPEIQEKATTYLSPAVEFLGQAAFVFVLTLFMLLKKEDLRNRFIRLLGDGKVTTTTRAVDDASSRISRYLLMNVTINTGFGVLITVGLVLLGVDYALLWGFIASVMRYVPYIGTPIGLIPPVLYSFATAPAWGGGWGQPLSVLALFLTLEVIGNNIFEPWLYGRSMGLSEVAQIVSAGFWVFLWGPIGLVLSGPIMVCLLVLGRHVRRFQFLAVLLGDQPALAPRVAFYQRLAARDQDEAAEVALAVARQAGPEESLESVVVPALCIARRDLQDGDLDAADFRFAVRGAREVVAELADLRKSSNGNTPDDNRVRVLLVPARDEAEHVAADALAAVLDPTRWDVQVAGDEMLASELTGIVEAFDPSIVVLVVLPPGGVSHCRYLVNRLRRKFAEMHVVVGRWGCGEDLPADEPASGFKGVDGVDHSFKETRKRLSGLVAVLAAERTKREEALPESNLAGTGNA